MSTFSNAGIASRYLLHCRGRVLDCRPGRPGGAVVVGVLNATPDSFSDGGRYLDPDAALRRAEEMLAEGAAVIDVGGESTRPAGSVYGAGATPTPADEELRRVLPIVAALAERFPEALLSIDTYKPEVARRALEAGAHLVNDITGARFLPEMPGVAAAFGAPLILMHSQGPPGAPAPAWRSPDATTEVRAALAEAAQRAQQMGADQIILDPGFGFGKTPAQNLELVGRLGELASLGRPVMVGLSRKSTIGAALGAVGAPAPVEARLFGTLGATAVAVLRGATLVRTHDVGPTVEMLRVLAAALDPSHLH